MRNASVMLACAMAAACLACGGRAGPPPGVVRMPPADPRPQRIQIFLRVMNPHTIALAKHPYLGHLAPLAAMAHGETEEQYVLGDIAAEIDDGMVKCPLPWAVTQPVLNAPAEEWKEFSVDTPFGELREFPGETINVVELDLQLAEARSTWAAEGHTLWTLLDGVVLGTVLNTVRAELLKYQGHFAWRVEDPEEH